MDYVKMLKKGILGFITGLAAVIVLGVSQQIAEYNPVACTAVITENCTPQVVISLYYAIVPTVVGSLAALANWLKHRKD